MSAQRHQSTQDILKNFIPLNTLPNARLSGICEKHHVEELSKGTVLFEQGDEAKEFIYLISGMISLYAGEMEVETIVTGSEVARFAIAHHLPRKVKAVTRSKARVVRIPTHLLDMETPEDDGQTYMVDEVEDQGGDWMTTMLQSPVFQRLPAANLQKVMMQMEEVAFAPGDVVVKQGDEADFYYIIKAGDCELIRQASEQARPIKLGELHSCDAFGEDALLSGNPRNVTVRMKGKGQMLRLSKANFIKLVKEPVLQYVELEEGQEKVVGGANWLDVRSPDEFAEGHIEGAVNIPFFSLRMKVAELRHDQLQVLVCANGRTSEAAAFLLLKFGFNALILKGGMAKWADDVGVKEALDKPSTSAAKPAHKEKTSAMTTVVSAPEEPSLEKTGDEQSKIAELEKLCAQSNEKLNKLTIERDNLQQQYDQQLSMVSELQLSSKLIADELTAAGAKKEGREAEVDQLLALEREKTTVLETELGQFRESIDILSEEVSAKDDELITLNTALSDAEKQKEKIADELAQQLAVTQQEVTKLITEKESLSVSVEEAKCENEQLSQAKSLLEQKMAQSVQDVSLGVAEKEARISELTEEVNQLRSNLANIEQTKVAQEASLLEQTAELKQVKESEKKAIEALKAESAARVEEFEDELSFLKQALTEKTENLDEHKKLTEEFKAQVESLKEKNQDTESVIIEKNVDIDVFTDKLKTAETKITTLQQQQVETEAALAEKEALLASSEERLVSIDSERVDLNKKLEQSDNELFSLLAEQTELEKRLNGALKLTDEFKSNEEAALAQADSLKQENEQAESALEKSAEELMQSGAQVQKLEQESEGLSEQVKRLKASLDDISSGKESIESELAQRLENSENELASTLAQVDSLKQENEQAESALEKSAEELMRSGAEVQKLEQESEGLSEQVKGLEASLDEISSGKESIESELAQRLDDLDNKLSSALESKQTLEEQLETASNEKEQAQQKLLALEDQLDTGLGDRRELNEELTQVREELVVARQEGEKEKAALSESLLQANVRVEEAESGLKQLSEEQMTAAQQHVEVESHLAEIKNAKAALELTLDNAVSEKESAQQQVESALDEQRQLKEQLVVLESSAVEQAKKAETQRVEQLSKLENKLERVNSEHLSSNEELASMRADNDALQQKLVDAESILSASTGDQKELLAQLDETRVESAEFKKDIESKQAEVDVLNEQLAELKNGGKQSEQEIQTLAERLQAAEKDLSSTVSEKEGLLLQLEGLEQRRVLDDETTNTFQQKVNELEQLLQQLEEEKEQLVTNAGNESDEKVVQLTEQLLAAQSEAKDSLKQLDDARGASEAEAKEKLELEEKLKAMVDESAGLRRKLKDVERVAVKNSDNSADQARIQELEEQLNEASTMLLDLEVKMETSLVGDDAADISEGDSDELKALQSELNLVREQTEKDIQAMQAKVENSEKMNLALKRKVISMQTLANQDVLPEEPPQVKKKGWWK